jgi:23S rRNA pseudouridine2605 synthase
MQERLQKIISRAGVASRRAGEEIIQAGRVRVNGRVVTELGTKADLGRDTVEIDGRRLVPEAARYIVLHKPRGVVSTLSDPEGRPTVATLLDGAGTRLYPVGRLDFATSGVLLVTNDGDFANGLLHPRGGVPKTYVLKVKGSMNEADLARWAEGVELDDGKTRPAEVRHIRHEEDKTWFEITIREGRNQQIRRMGEATGFPVMRLARTSFAGITSEGVRPGKWRALTLEELLALRDQYGVPKRVRGAASRAQADDGAEEATRRRRGGPGTWNADTRDRTRPAADRKPSHGRADHGQVGPKAAPKASTRAAPKTAPTRGPNAGPNAGPPRPPRGRPSPARRPSR